MCRNTSGFLILGEWYNTNTHFLWRIATKMSADGDTNFSRVLNKEQNGVIQATLTGIFLRWLINCIDYCYLRSKAKVVWSAYMTEQQSIFKIRLIYFCIGDFVAAWEPTILKKINIFMKKLLTNSSPQR